MTQRTDMTFAIPTNQNEAAFSVERPATGKAAILVTGLKLGGQVTATLGGKPAAIDLQASGGLTAGKADQALITAELPAGRSKVSATSGPSEATLSFDVENTLFCLPTELTYTDPEDLNELDLLYFGKEREQRSRIERFVGNQECIGLARSDGSMVVLGVGKRTGRIAVPAAAQQAAKRVYSMRDPGRPSYKALRIEDGYVTVEPGAATAVDCGSALIVSGPFTPPPKLGLANIRETFCVGLANVGTRPVHYPWRGEPPSDPGRLGSLGGVGLWEAVFGGIKFAIDAGPKGVIALEELTEGAATNLPRQAPFPGALAIPVNRKADALFFLHALVAGAGLDYCLRYEDGRDVTLSVREGRNIAGFRVDPVWTFADETQGTATLGAATWSQYTGRGCVYRFEWAAPADRRDVAIRAIEVKAAAGASPLVFGITGALRR